MEEKGEIGEVVGWVGRVGGEVDGGWREWRGD